MAAFRCSRCDKKLSLKTARMIDGKVLCSPCAMPPTRAGLPLNLGAAVSTGKRTPV